MILYDIIYPEGGIQSLLGGDVYNTERFESVKFLMSLTCLKMVYGFPEMEYP